MANLKRIVVLGDSMAMPRVEGKDCVWWDETWPFLLQQKLIKSNMQIDIINCSSRARTIDSICGQDFLDHVTWKKPDFIVLEIGIVDCAPRIFSKKEKALLNNSFMPACIKKYIIHLRSQKREIITKRAPLAKVYTPPYQFKFYLQKFFSRLEELNRRIRLIVIPILANDSFMETKSPGFVSNVNIYNSILKEWCKVIGATWFDPSTIFMEQKKHTLFGSDGYHFNIKGHCSIANLLYYYLLDILSTL